MQTQTVNQIPFRIGTLLNNFAWLYDLGADPRSEVDNTFTSHVKSEHGLSALIHPCN